MAKYQDVLCWQTWIEDDNGEREAIFDCGDEEFLTIDGKEFILGDNDPQDEERYEKHQVKTTCIEACAWFAAYALQVDHLDIDTYNQIKAALERVQSKT